MPVLRLYEDTLGGNVGPVTLPARPRMVFVVHGTLEVDGRMLRDGEAVGGTAEMGLKAGAEGATCWRWDLSAEGTSGTVIARPGVRSREKLAAVLDTIPKGELLLRGDSVGFPPGGCAHLHRHRGPGIRCLLEGGIRIDTGGRSTSYGPGGPWFENGSDPVFARAAQDRATRFVRVMVLPRELLGQSSFMFVNEEDKSKPRVQQYKVFVDQPIDLAAG